MTRRHIIATTAALTALTFTTAPAGGVTHAATAPPCSHLVFLHNSSGVSIGGEVWCPLAQWWVANVGCSNTRYGVVKYKAIGWRATRWESQARCPVNYPYAVRVSDIQGAAK